MKNHVFFDTFFKFQVPKHDAMHVKTISAGRGDCSGKNEIQFVKIGACIWSGEQFL